MAVHNRLAKLHRVFGAIRGLVQDRRSNHDDVWVKVHDNWGDADEALDLLLPGKSRRWGNIRFTRRKFLFGKPDYHLILNQPWGRALALNQAPERILFAIGEPPTPCHEPLHRGQGSGTVVFTCDGSMPSRHGSERRYVVSPCMARTWSVNKTIDELALQAEIRKTWKLSWVTSDLSILSGHRERLKFLSQIRSRIDFDLFGRGFNEIHDKWSGIAPYEYSFAYENTIADGYFTEKLMDCLVAQTVPLYVGSPDIGRYFPDKSIITIDPHDPHVVHKILDILNFDDRSARLGALEEAKQLVLFKYNLFIRIAQYIAQDHAKPTTRRMTRIVPVRIDLRGC